MHGRRLAGLGAASAVALASVWACDVTEAPTDGDGAAFAALQTRGEQAMGVDQYSSMHVFDALADGGRIELQRDEEDPDGVERIRGHLRMIAEAFNSGDFSTPAFVHMQEVPGAAVMAAKQDEIEYVYGDLPRGGELRLVTDDPDALEAIHEFMEYQREDHRAGGRDHPAGHERMRRHHPDHAEMPDHEPGDHPPHGDMPDHAEHGDGSGMHGGRPATGSP